jgi:hypothetical protein
MPAAGSGSSGSASAAAATGKQQQQAQKRNDGKDDGPQKKQRDVGSKDKRRMMVWPVMLAQYFGLVSLSRRRWTERRAVTSRTVDQIQSEWHSFRNMFVVCSLLSSSV